MLWIIDLFFKSLFIWSIQTEKGRQLYGLKIFSPLFFFLAFHIFWPWKDFLSLIWNSLQFLIFFVHNILYDGYLLSFCWMDELSSYCVAAGFLMWDSAPFWNMKTLSLRLPGVSLATSPIPILSRLQHLIAEQGIFRPSWYLRFLARIIVLPHK